LTLLLPLTKKTAKNLTSISGEYNNSAKNPAELEKAHQVSDLSGVFAMD
jgi:hypothetical protein